MKRPFRAVLMISGVVMLACALLSNRSTAVAGEPSLLIGQVKVTSSNGQFLTLYNNSDETIDMGTVQLAYYNNFDLSKSTSNKFITLSGKLAPGNYYLISDGALFVCYKMTVNAVSLGFSSTAGMVQVLRLTQSTPGGLVSSSLVDSVSWSKTAAAGAQTLPSATTDFLQRVWPAALAKTPGGGSWQSVHPTSAESCDLQTQISSSITPSAPVPPAVTPPVTTIAAVVNEVAATPQNIGLVAPELDELFPNPAAPQTDDNDEFIELYNPNETAFDLNGYRIEVGTTYSRGYTFKAGTLASRSYTAFSITETGLQLSNSEGQARLLDSSGVMISETAAYEDAPEGSSWSLVGDSWQWSTSPTPNALNTGSAADDSATGGSKASGSTAKKTSTGKVAGTSTVAPSASSAQLDDAAPLHPLVLAGVGLGAVAYALYEYRRDMANRLFQLRRYLRVRREARS